ncbi:MAG TPA: hypothetical protein VFA84_12670 [Acidimicrobiales bacterium]|nr:hypothetical protein [Acidimicrobiales bacterium]
MTRWLLRLLVLAGLGFVAWKAWQLLQEGDEDHSGEWAAARPAAASTPVATATARAAAPPKTAWVKPVGSTCPPGYPVKAKTASKVFRVPGMFSYEDSKPERCYCDEQAAAADGFTRAKR